MQSTYPSNHLRCPQDCKDCPYLSYARILHASPDAPPVDIYLNDKLVTANLAYRDFTPYIPIAEGRYNIKVFPSGKKDKPILNTNVSVPGNLIFTIAATGYLKDLQLLLLPEDTKKKPVRNSLVRFCHLSPNAPAVDVDLDTGAELFSDVSFRQYTPYIEFNPGTYTLKVLASGTSDTVLTVPNVLIKPNRYYTIYAVGLLNGNPPLQLLLPLDGKSYIDL